MRFEAVTKDATFLDPFNNMSPRTITVEVRRDPLTGRTSRVCRFRSPKWQKPDLDKLAAGTEATCPFCPNLVKKVTPAFTPDITPEGRWAEEDVVLFPNIAPYDGLSVVATLGERHSAPMTEIEPELIARTWGLILKFFRRLEEIGHPESVYHLMNWNFMPPAGSSIIHPHIQAVATSSAPNFLREKLKAAGEYQAEHQTNFWDDLVKAERDGPRWLGRIGRTSWLSAFAPQGVMGDVTAVVDDISSTLDLTEADLADLAAGTVKALAAYDKMGVYSFNQGFYAGTRADGQIRVHATLSPRTPLNPAIGTSDINSIQYVQGDGFCLVSPEELNKAVREEFQAA